jgi:GntR family transcriptional repressor for pyruvate dehydrogenase complex
VERKRAFEVVIDHLRDLMAEGELKPGDKLPAERELAQRFGVSRTSAREALRVLETLGVVTIRPGAEHGATLTREVDGAFTSTLSLLLDLRHISPAEVVELRLMLESWAAQEQAERQDPEALAALRRIVEEMEAPEIEAQRFHELDAEFHLKLVDSTGNRLIGLIEHSAAAAFRRVISDVAKIEIDGDELRDVLRRQHRAILEAIEKGDRSAADERIRHHISYWGQRVAALQDAA